MTQVGIEVSIAATSFAVTGPAENPFQDSTTTRKQNARTTIQNKNYKNWNKQKLPTSTIQLCQKIVAIESGNKPLSILCQSAHHVSVSKVDPGRDSRSLGKLFDNQYWLLNMLLASFLCS
eukprot:Gregarina_sp_Poly_1__3037@NODE_1852_length_3208_cov_513_823941_g1201_i0_p2_GENE_NODE_1852_length_3208_cov_513_823941_g1201_i0NODE_1852_length_3208_cov_513_823941_g1201_i0_p2_ORF_typecomplete_len120_score4_36_NODE_1852_length_3208_cov_513_823941_g1201_i06821041